VKVFTFNVAFLAREARHERLRSAVVGVSSMKRSAFVNCRSSIGCASAFKPDRAAIPDVAVVLTPLSAYDELAIDRALEAATLCAGGPA
jgi:hypothetical protein